MPKPDKSKPDPLALVFQQEGATIVTAIPSDMLVQPGHVEQFCRQIDRALDAAPAGTSLLLSLANVRYMSSIVLGRLIAFQKKLDKQHGRLMLCDLSPDLRDVIRHAKLDKFIAVYPTAAEALNSKTFSWASLLGMRKKEN